jgi:hypothetical protein
MNAEPHVQPYKVNPDSELGRRLKEADREPVILENEGVRFRVVREADEVQTTDDPWANYDPEKVIAAIHASAGALKGVDVEQLLKDIYEERGQDSAGRPG